MGFQGAKFNFKKRGVRTSYSTPLLVPFSPSIRKNCHGMLKRYTKFRKDPIFAIFSKQGILTYLILIHLVLVSQTRSPSIEIWSQQRQRQKHQVSIRANLEITTRPAPLTNSVFKFYWGIMRPFGAGPGPSEMRPLHRGTEWRPGIWVLQPKQNSSGIINGVLSVTKMEQQ